MVWAHELGHILGVYDRDQADEDDRPDTYQLLKVEADDGIARESFDPSSLSPGWRNNEAETRRIGDDWLARGETALLKVPSAITPETWNWVLNPRHGQARYVVIVHGEEHPYDSRLFRGQ